MSKNSASRLEIASLGEQIAVFADTIAPLKISTMPYSTMPNFDDPSKSIANIGILIFFVLPIVSCFRYITPMQIETFKTFINNLADMSGKYISAEFGKAHDIDFKKDASPVTEVDKNTEAMLREAILKNFPANLWMPKKLTKSLL